MSSAPLEHRFIAGRVLLREPLITISRRSSDWSMGLLSFCPALLLNRPGLHILTPSWWIDRQAAAEIATAWHAVQQYCPEAHFVVLADQPDEAYWLQQRGIQAFVISELCFVDEGPFQPRTDATIAFDAIYNAVLAPYKRHWLAKEVERLSLVYRPGELAELPAIYAEFRQQLPQAVFQNHLQGAGDYRWISHQELVGHLHRAAVGLALSAVEGAMKASVEYLFAGLPVVTTANRGGRDWLLCPPYAMHCGASSGEVAKAVARQARAAPPAAEIRHYATTVIHHERRALETLLATLVWELFRSELPAATFAERYFGSVKFQSCSRLLAEVKAALQAPL